jgi:predicted DCC family thiol-disulfide oxidoreductase YuxK
MYTKPVESGTASVYFDDNCALCQRFKRFVERRDRGRNFRFERLSDWAGALDVRGGRAREGWPDSVIVITAGGAALVRSRAVIYVLYRLGGVWGSVALLSRAVPSRLADALYDWIARHRHCAIGAGDDGSRR